MRQRWQAAGSEGFGHSPAGHVGRAGGSLPLFGVSRRQCPVAEAEGEAGRGESAVPIESDPSPRCSSKGCLD